MAATPEPRHKIRVVADQQQIGGWTSYEIASNMIEPADGFTMRRPFDNSSWNILRRDARVRVYVDDSPILDGFIDDREKASKAGEMTITGRDRSGRLVQESAPRINYEGLELTAAILELASPWFTKITLSDARNRKIRTGKSRKVPVGNEPIIIRSSTGSAGRIHAGTMRWAAIQEIVSKVGLICWSSADGKELFVGKPNDSQAPLFIVRKSAGTSVPSTCRDLIYRESNGDRYSAISVVGSGGGTEVDFGLAVSTRHAVVFDNEANRVDGTGRDFAYPKRLLMPEANYDSDDEAARQAELERARRDFKRTTIQAEMPYHGQWFGGSSATIFAPNTVAAVVDEDFDPPLELDALIYSCSYKRSAKEGEITMIEMVPTGTEVVL